MNVVGLVAVVVLMTLGVVCWIYIILGAWMSTLDLTKLRCEKCGNRNLRRYSFGKTPHGQYHDEKFPNAMLCSSCDHIMPHGGIP